MAGFAKTKRTPITGVILAAVFACVVGCGDAGDRPELGSVTGLVTLDGQPLNNAVVLFKTQGKRSSRGFTDEKGRYTLSYIRDIEGAAVGEHRVSIDRLPQVEGQQYSRLPSKFNRESTLDATVSPGHNTIDWKLKSDS